MWEPRLICPIADPKELERITSRPETQTFDTIKTQLTDLIKSDSPDRALSASEMEAEIHARLDGRLWKEFGTWVHYPWSRRLVHVLKRADFIRLRTDRNRYKITTPEQKTLAGKRVGLVGLSVGASVALALGLERSFGELRLADFDTLDLSNLNRIPFGIADLALPKCVLAARRLFELDPYLNVKVFPRGLTEETAHDFFHGGGDLDLVIDECDSLDIKIRLRNMAKRMRIPVIMETSDRGLLDVERFDYDPDRPIFHGRVGDPDPGEFARMTSEEKIPFILGITGVETASARGKASLIEIGASIKTWPQLGSAIFHGGGAVADTSRRILLGEPIESGRFHLDFEELVPSARNPAPIVGARSGDAPSTAEFLGFHAELDKLEEETRALADRIDPSTDAPSHLELNEIVGAGRLATSLANNQPWLFTSIRGLLFLWRRETPVRLDPMRSGSAIGLGACIENVIIMGRRLGYSVQAQAPQPFPRPPASPPSARLTCVFRFTRRPASPQDVETPESDLSDWIPRRRTERATPRARTPLPARLKAMMEGLVLDEPGARLQILEASPDLDHLAEQIGRADRWRLFGRQTHQELFSELRSSAEARSRGDGLDLASFDLPPAGRAALEIMRSWETVERIKLWGLGRGLTKFTAPLIRASSAVGFLAMKAEGDWDWIRAGRLIQRLWLSLTRDGFTLHPVTGLIFLMNAMDRDQAKTPPCWLNPWQCGELDELSRLFNETLPTAPDESRAFLFRLAPAQPARDEDIEKTRIRYPPEAIFRPIH